MGGPGTAFPLGGGSKIFSRKKHQIRPRVPALHSSSLSLLPSVVFQSFFWLLLRRDGGATTCEICSESKAPRICWWSAIGTLSGKKKPGARPGRVEKNQLAWGNVALARKGHEFKRGAPARANWELGPIGKIGAGIGPGGGGGGDTTGVPSGPPDRAPFFIGLPAEKPQLVRLNGKRAGIRGHPL